MAGNVNRCYVCGDYASSVWHAEISPDDQYGSCGLHNGTVRRIVHQGWCDGCEDGRLHDGEDFSDYVLTT